MIPKSLLPAAGVLAALFACSPAAEDPHGDDGHTHEADDGHSHEADDGHSHEADDGHSHEADDGHSHEADDGHSHEADDGHSHEADDGHSHEADDGHSHEADDGHSHEASEAPQADGTAEGGHVDIPPIVRRNLGITFARVEARHVAQTIRVPGSFELRPLARREYRMELSGRVELLVDQFDRVEPGQPLYRFQSPTWPELLHEIIVGEQAMATAQAEIEVGKAKITESGRKLELVQQRIEALAKAQFKKVELEVQAAELEASLPRLEAELHLARTQLANARRTRKHALHRAATASGIDEEELEREVDVAGIPTPVFQTIDWIEVRAVEPGIIERLDVTDGAFVEPTAAVLSTVDPELVRFRALALQGDLPQLLGSVQTRIVPPASSGRSGDDSVEATMAFGLEAHPAERTLTLLATPAELRPWIRPGVSAFLEIVVASSEGPALAVPRSSVVQDGLTHVFFRRDPSDADRALRVEADLGVSDGRWIVLNAGVMPGDEVVLDGAYELKLATQSTSTGPGGSHVHADGSSHTDH